MSPIDSVLTLTIVIERTHSCNPRRSERHLTIVTTMVVDMALILCPDCYFAVHAGCGPVQLIRVRLIRHGVFMQI